MSSETMTPAQRETRWRLRLRFAIEAATEDEARNVLGLALAGLHQGLPLRGEPVVHPRQHRIPDRIWVAELEPDLTRLPAIDPDDAPTRCRFVEGHFPMGVTWSVPQDTERSARWDWPTDIWSRQPGRDDVLLHPAVRAVTIFCAARQV